jgi:Domain of unknown function (DUF1937)
LSADLIYLASPYSHPDPEVREQRFQTVCKVAAKLMSKGHLIFCPIAHTHPLVIHGQLATGWEFWDKYDRAILSKCSEFWVVCLAGWQTSVGVQAEMAIAKELNLPIRFVDSDGETITPLVEKSSSDCRQGNYNPSWGAPQ